MASYILVIFGVISCIIAAACLMLATSGYYHLYLRETSEPPKKAQVKALLVVGILFIVFASIAWQIYNHLFSEYRHVLEHFGIWYAIGFVSRLLLLAKRHMLLSPLFDVDLDEVIFALIYATLGPLVTLHLIWVIFIKKEKNFWE